MSAYNFVDTMQPSPATPRPAEAVCFNGIWFDDEIEGFRTLNVQGRELLSKDIDTYDIGKKYGDDFRWANYPTRTITVTYQMKAESDALFREYFNDLNLYLKAEQAKLVFNDEPDKYFIATKASNDDVEPGKNSVIGTIEFYCTDPAKYSTVEKEFTASVNSDGVLEATIVNNGSVEVPINYEIKHNAENGYIGIISEDGVIQLGKAEETDGYTYTKDEQLHTPSASRKIFNPTGWKADTGKLCWNSSVDTSGTLNTVTVTVEDPDDPTTALRMAAQGSQKTGLSGGMWSFDVKDSNSDGALNFYAYVDVWFESGLPGQTGAQVVALADANNRLVAAQAIWKTDKTGIVTHTEFWVGDGSGGRRCVKSFSFEGASNYSKNPYGEPNGWSDILKEGGNIQFYYNEKYYSYYVPELASAKVRKVQLFIGQYDGRGRDTPNYVSRNYFRQVGLLIMGVNKWADRINRYQSGDKIYIDGENTKIYVNDMIKMQDEVRGSKYFKAKPGTTKVQFTCSDFCETKPTIKATIREAYL